MTADGTVPVVARSERWKIVAVTATAVFMAFLDVTVVNIVFPDVRRSFAETSLSDLSWVLNAYNVVFAALLVPAGRLADRFGHRRVYLDGMLLFLGASLLCAVAPSAWVLVVGRVLQAAGGAIMVPTSLALVLTAFSVNERATATGLWGGAAGVAAAAGPTIGGVIAEVGDWRWVFLLNLPIGLVTIVAARRVLRRDRPEDDAALPDLPGTVALALGMGALALGIVKGPDWGWGDTRVLASWLSAVLLLTVFTRRCLTHPHPVIEASFFRLRAVAAANLATLVFSCAFYAVLLSVVLFMNGVWHYSVLEAGLALSVAPMSAAVSSAIGGRLTDRFGGFAVAIPGALAFAGGCTLYAVQLGPTPDFLTAYAPAAVLGGAGVGLVFASLTSMAVFDLPDDRFATGTAIVSCSRQVGAVVGVSVLVAILQAADSPSAVLDAYDLSWTLMAAAGCATAVIVLGAAVRAAPVGARTRLGRGRGATQGGGDT